jgi:hypothetical protein
MFSIFTRKKIMTAENNNQPAFQQLKQQIAEKWPEADYTAIGAAELSFSTGLGQLDALFSTGGIPYGQLIEINGSVSSGKTSLLFAILASLTRTATAAYIDFANSFYPAAAVSGGINMAQLMIIKPGNLRDGVRSAELLFRHRAVETIVFDLVGQTELLPVTMMHRLRRQTVKSKALIFFLTENSSSLIPTSMVSLKLQVSRVSHSIIEVTIAKSRICREGIKVEVAIDK